MEIAKSDIPTAPLEGPVQVDLEFRFPRPKYHYGTGKNAGRLKPNAPRWHNNPKGPDRDNLDKTLLDTLTAMGFWRGDGQACKGGIEKVYTETRPGCLVRIETLE